MGPLPCATHAGRLPAGLPPQRFSTTLSLRSFSRNSYVQFKPVEKVDQCVWRGRLCLRGCEPKVWLKVKPLKILSFKGRAQNGEGESNSCKNTVQVSFPDQEKEAVTSGISDQEEVSGSYSSKNQEQTFVTYLGVQTLVKKWILMLRTQSTIPQNEKVTRQEPEENVETKNEHLPVKPAASSLPKAALHYFLKLEIAIKVPLLVFIPGYLAVNIMHGAEVSRELTPLWVLGPLIVALYIKLLQAVCALYIFTIRQTIRIIKNVPSYYSVIHTFFFEGRIKELFAVLWWPVKSVLNLDCREFLKQKLRELKEAVYEMYLDFIESIWPHYCRTIRFLKKANLI